MVDQKAELKNRIETRQKELEAKLATLKADARASTRDEIASIESRLNELRETLRDGWEGLTEAAAAKLNQWLGRS